jgi:hypothetical protein
VTATIETGIPTISNITGGGRCDAGTVTMSATTNKFGAIKWYAALTGGTLLGTGNSFTTPSLGTSTTYYIESANCNGTSTPRQPVLATVVTTPAITAIVPASGCIGTNVVLNATANNGGILTWFDVPNGGVSSTSYATVSNIQSNTTRYVSAYNDYTEVVSPYATTTCESARTAVLATAMAVPTVSSVTPAALCGLTTATVSATSASGTLKWYDALTNGNLLATATSYTTPQMAAPATYYVTSIGSNGCASTPRTSVAVTFTGPTVGTVADVNAQTATACSFVGSSLSGQASFVWQRSFDGGSTWTNLTAGLDAGVTYSGFSGTTEASSTLSISTALKIYSGAKYRIKLTQTAGCVNYSNAATLTVADVFGSCSSTEISNLSTTTTSGTIDYPGVMCGSSAGNSWGNLWDTEVGLGCLANGYYVFGGSPAAPAWIEYDFGSAYYINQVYIAAFSFNSGSTWCKGWDTGSIQVSNDNSSWTTVATTTYANSKTNPYYAYNFDAVNARYIRIYTDANNRVNDNALSTFRVFAAPSGTPPYISNALATSVQVANGTAFTASATATATGVNTISSYQWSKSSTLSGTYTNLSNSGTVSGATSSTLTITGFLTGNTGYYKLTATQSNGCTVSTTINAIWNSTPYYTTTTGYGALQNTASWTSSSGGTGGTAPTDFNSGKFFILANSGGNVYTPATAWTLGGTLQLNTNKLTLGNYDATIGAINDATTTAYVKTNGTGRLIQSVTNLPLLFPIGNTTYDPVTINNRTGTADNFSVNVSDAVLTGGSTGTAITNLVNRTWTINKTAANASPGCDLTFAWQAGDVSGSLSTSDMKLFAWSGSAWVEQNSGAISRTSTSITYSGYTGALSNTLFMVGNPVPTITSFTPTSGSAGATITINGTGFTNASAVTFGETAATFTVISSTQITAVVASGTSGSVSVTTPGGPASLAGFTYLAAPTITDFTPAEATTGQTVTITGTNFVNISSVTFGGVNASSFTVVSSTAISAVVGSGATGSVSVSNGSIATKAGFIFVKPIPTLTMSDITKNLGDASFSLTAPSSSSLGAFTYTSSDQAVATISGKTITITGAGTATITTNQAATADYGEGSTTCTLTVKTKPASILPT